MADWGDDWSEPAKPNNNRGSDWGGSAKKNNNQGDDWGGPSKPNNNQADDWGGPSKPSNNQESDWGGNDTESRPTEDDQPKKRFKREDGTDEERPAPYKPEAIDLAEEAKLQGEQGDNFHRYKDQKVACLPEKAVTPVEKFQDVIASELLLQNLRSQRFSDMTPIQKWAIPAILGGHDLIGCAQTGSGKTAAFLLPVLQTLLKSDVEMPDPNRDRQDPYCLIISPTRELARQIFVHAKFLANDSIIRCQCIYGQISNFHLKSQLCTGCHILVATPGKLKDFVERGWIGFKNIKYIILDEGDRLVDDGFAGDIEKIFSHETMPPKEERQTLFFSATFKHSVQETARNHLKDDFIFLTVGRIGAANEDITQEFLVAPRSEKKRELKKILEEIPDTDKTIIFTQTKQAADMLAGFFNAMKLSSTSIHGDRHQSQREQAIASFKRGEKRFLISSPVGNRGLDLPKVALVINYDLPNNIDEYVHRIGRTGRAGHTGKAISFYDETRDTELLPDLIEILKNAGQDIPPWMKGESTGAGNGASDGASGTNTADDDWGLEPVKSAGASDDWDEGNLVDKAPANSDEAW